MNSNHLIHQVDLEILNQDWNVIRSTYQTLAKKIQTNTLSNDSVSGIVHNSAGSVYGYTQYNLNKFGSLIRSDAGLSLNRDSWCGPMLYRLCPWYNTAKQIFKDLNFQSISWSVTFEDIQLHVDPKVDDEKIFGQSQINYIVHTEDTLAETIVYDKANDIRSTYPSTPGTAWLLNTNFPHEMKCNGRREIIQFKFLNDFDEVLSALEKIGPIRLDALRD